jgi:hypothetical protein
LVILGTLAFSRRTVHTRFGIREVELLDEILLGGRWYVPEQTSEDLPAENSTILAVHLSVYSHPSSHVRYNSSSVPAKHIPVSVIDNVDSSENPQAKLSTWHGFVILA